MPIPLLQPEASPERSHLRLADPAPALRGSLLYPRAIAHFVDMCVVAGFSLWSAKIFSVLLLSAHGRAIASTGKMAGSVFREAFSQSHVQLFAASFAALSVVYFVGLPLVWSRTPGQGLLGLRVTSDDGNPLTASRLAFRMGGCALAWGTAGFLCVLGLRKRDGRFFHDMLSGTRVTRD